MLIPIRYPVSKGETIPASWPKKLADPTPVPRTPVGKTSGEYRLSVAHIIFCKIAATHVTASWPVEVLNTVNKKRLAATPIVESDMVCFLPSSVFDSSIPMYGPTIGTAEAIR
jgi:hypothetical protein